MTVFGVQVCVCGRALSYEGDRAGEREAKDAFALEHAACGAVAPEPVAPPFDVSPWLEAVEAERAALRQERDVALAARDDAERIAEDLGKINLALQGKLAATVKLEVSRDAGSGQFVSDKAAKADPSGTVTETVKKPSRGRGKD